MVTVNKGSFTGIDCLAIVFITLKLTDNIDWSWWLVLIPIWICIVVTFFEQIANRWMD